MDPNISLGSLGSLWGVIWIHSSLPLPPGYRRQLKALPPPVPSAWRPFGGRPTHHVAISQVIFGKKKWEVHQDLTNGYWRYSKGKNTTSINEYIMGIYKQH
jgi:hypothetical protein